MFFSINCFFLETPSGPAQKKTKLYFRTPCTHILGGGGRSRKVLMGGFPGTPNIHILGGGGSPLKLEKLGLEALCAKRCWRSKKMQFWAHGLSFLRGKRDYEDSVSQVLLPSQRRLLGITFSSKKTQAASSELRFLRAPARF